jgi:dienelactone hydrolase
MPINRDRLRDLFGIKHRGVGLYSIKEEQHDGYVLETLDLLIDGAHVRGLLTRPDTPGKHPAILYAHSHGGVYTIGADELLQGRDYLLDPPLGPLFAKAGYVTLCIDLPCFGKRATVSESYAAKALLWYDRALICEMLGDQQAALSYLIARDDVDPHRVGAFGISMGCTLSYWLAAVDERIAAVAHLCCFADMRTMIQLGAHDGHGIYMVVPGLLDEADAGAIGALITPRPQLVCIGEADKLTPLPAFEMAWHEMAQAYVGYDTLSVVREPGVGHQETPRMRQAVFEFFARHLHP